jgi:hypothetical protein
MTRRHLVTATLFLATVTAFAQEAPSSNGPLQSQPNPGPRTVLSVASVLSLHAANVDDSIILAKLAQSNQPLNLSTDDILQLKQAGVSDAVVRAMIAPTTGGPQRVVVRNETLEKLHSMNATGATLPYDTGDTLISDDPLAPHDSGIYLATTTPTGQTKLAFMDRAAISGVKMNVGAVFTFFAYPVHVNYEIPSPKSSIRTTSPNPVFYFYFDDKAAGLGKSAWSAANVSSPSQFLLEQFNAGKKDRQLTGMKFGIFSGVSDGEKHLPFTVERLRAGLYKVTITNPLKPGEYALVIPPPPLNTNVNAQPQNPNDAPKPDIFDFAIDKT